MSRVHRTLPALDIEFLTGYPYFLNDPEVTIPPQQPIAAMDCRRCLLPLSAVSCTCRWTRSLSLDAGNGDGTGTVRARAQAHTDSTFSRIRPLVCYSPADDP